MVEMNIFICNRYDSKNEDIYLITSRIPNEKDKIYCYKYDQNRNINLERTYHLISEESHKNNIPQKNEESEELQIIEYPYQPHQTQNSLNRFYSSLSKMNNSLINNDSDYYNCFNHTNINNNKENIEKKRMIKKLSRKKQSFSCFSNLNSNIESQINDKISFESSDVEDTIKGEDNINISKYKMRHKNIQNRKKENNFKNIPNNILKKNIYKCPYRNELLKKNFLNINKIKTQKESNINKKIFVNKSNNILSNINYIKNMKAPKSQKKYVVTPKISKKDNLNIYNRNFKDKLNSEIKGDFSSNFIYKNNKFLKDFSNNCKNKKHQNSIYKNFSDDNIFIHGYKYKQNDNNKKSFIENKNKFNNNKRKIKKELINKKISKDGKILAKRKK